MNEELGLDKLLTAINGNIGFVFCHGDMDEIRKTVTENKVPSIFFMVDISPSFTFFDRNIMMCWLSVRFLFNLPETPTTTDRFLAPATRALALVFTQCAELLAVYYFL